MTDTLHATLATPGWERDPGAWEGVVLSGAAVVFWLFGGLPGAALALAVGSTAVFLPSVAVFALAQVALAVVLPETPAPGTILLGELPLLGVLAPAIDRHVSRRRLGVAGLLGGAIVGLAVAAAVLAPRPWVAALVVFGAVALCLYGTHRYAVVRYTIDE